MINDINPSLLNECQQTIARISGSSYSTPQKCFATLGELRRYFTEFVRYKYLTEDISNSTKNKIDRLLACSAPMIDFDISESFIADNKSRELSVVPTYTLTISTTADEIAQQAQDFYATAYQALTNPLLQKNVTPETILKALVDRYSQEAGVDDPEEIQRIITRICNRYFTASATDIDQSLIEPLHEVNINDVLRDLTTRQNDFALLLSKIKAFPNTLKVFISERCATKKIPNAFAISELATWISMPLTSFDVFKTECKPYIDYEKRIIVRPFPELSYQASVNREELRNSINSFDDVVEGSLRDVLLATSIEELKRDIEQIPSLPACDISKYLRRVIERNFKVKVVEIHSEDDKYATPEYFTTNRANIDRVTTTRPAVIAHDGRIICKGIYLVPKNNSTDSNTNLF